MYNFRYCPSLADSSNFSSMKTLTLSPLVMVKKQEPEDEKILQLLKPPTLTYIRELSKIVDQDPEYLTFHSGSVALRVKSLLAQHASAGWDLPERQVIRVVKQAIVRLRSFEK